MKSAVIIFPGSNCDRDIVVALNKIGSKVEKIWHKEANLSQDLDLIVIPGGFSFGDYLRSGAMASISPISSEIVRAANRGVKIMGICNGFQILTEIGLLDGILLRNQKGKFICKTVNLKVENNKTIFTKNYQSNQIIQIPIANMDGCYFAEDGVIKKLYDNEQVAFKYCNEFGKIDEISNINGSVSNIAGIFNKNKNILGMMPHPERAIEKEIGSNDGLNIFHSVL